MGGGAVVSLVQSNASESPLSRQGLSDLQRKAGRLGISVLTSILGKHPPLHSSPLNSAFGLFLCQILHVTYGFSLLLGVSGLPVSFLSSGPVLCPFSSIRHCLEPSGRCCLAHGAIPASSKPSTFRPCFPSWHFLLYPTLVPGQQLLTGGRSSCVRARNWGSRMSYCHSGACFPVPLSWAGSPGAVLAQAGLQGRVLPTCLSSCVCVYT